MNEHLPSVAVILREVARRLEMDEPGAKALAISSLHRAADIHERTLERISELYRSLGVNVKI